jgi:hypothetical protein
VIVEVAALLLATLAGVALARLLDRTASMALLVGEGILLGIGVVAAILFALALLHVPWSRTAVLIPLLVSCGGTGALACRLLPADRRGRLSPHWIDLLTLIALAGYARFATLAPVWEFDYLVDFGGKARSFFEARTIDWTFLQSSIERASHPDYPPLLPLSFDYLALARGAWNDWAHGLLNVAFALALLLIVRQLAAEETESPSIAALITLAMMPLAASPWIGLGEAPLIAFGIGGVLLLRSGRVPIAAVLLGLAACAKNEGLTLIMATAIALAVAGRAKTIPRLWPAAVIPIPWMLARAMHRLPTDLASGDVLARVLGHLMHPASVLGPLLGYSLGKPLFWIGIVVALLVLRRALFVDERFAVTVIVLQFGFYLAAYLTSPHDLQWHVRWSWERLVSHLTPLLAYVVVVELKRFAFPASLPVREEVHDVRSRHRGTELE